jgi:hypothetical protein
MPLLSTCRPGTGSKGTNGCVMMMNDYDDEVSDETTIRIDQRYQPGLQYHRNKKTSHQSDDDNETSTSG